MNLQKLSVNQLLNKRVHLGHQKGQFNPKIASFLYGVREGIHFLDLNITLLSLRRILFLIQELVCNGGKILFVGTDKDIFNNIAKLAANHSQYFISQKWIGGFLTNYYTVLKSKKKNNKFNFNQIKNLTELQNLIFFFNVNKNKVAINEASLLNIPTIGIIDTNTSIKNITYTIPSNDDSVETINLYCNVIDYVLKKNIIIKK